MNKFNIKIDKLGFTNDSINDKIDWLKASVNDNISQHTEMYEFRSDGQPHFIADDNPEWHEIYRLRKNGNFERHNICSTPSWRFVDRRHITALADMYAERTIEMFFEIADDAVAVQFKLVFSHV